MKAIPLNHKQYTEANREAWNEVTPIHQKARKVNFTEQFKTKGFSTLDPVITAKLKEIGLEGKQVAQLGCNNGRELLSLINLGAASGTGFDISDAAIAEATTLAEVAGLPGAFVRTDVYDIGAEYYRSFDLVYISIGVLSWLPDLERFFAIASALLKDKGYLLIYEMHPFLNMLATEDEPEFEATAPLQIVHSYFKTDPWVQNTGIDYIGRSSYEAKTSYNFSHSLAAIFQSVINSGITIREFQEYSHDISTIFAHLEPYQKAPLCYILLGQKQG